jgi:hypothetical protein
MKKWHENNDVEKGEGGENRKTGDKNLIFYNYWTEREEGGINSKTKSKS